MNLHKMITEKDISRNLGRLIESPIRVGNLSHLGLNQETFLRHFSPMFDELDWDPYDARRLKVEMLKKILPKESAEIDKHFQAYFTGRQAFEIFNPWIQKLSSEQVGQLEAIQAWRRRSIAQFMVEEKKEGIRVVREKQQEFAQDLMASDFRSLPRIFSEAPAEHVENELFRYLLIHFFQMAQSVKKDVRKARITAHFMSVRALSSQVGDNSPEGAHEDGADFIVSALVINRHNIEGGETQIIEQLSNGERIPLFKRILKAGEFVFQADTREEVVYGNDLWHHVTPFSVVEPNIPGWRDIIGFDILTG